MFVDLGFSFKASYAPNKILKDGLVYSSVDSVLSFSTHEALSSIPIWNRHWADRRRQIRSSRPS